MQENLQKAKEFAKTAQLRQKHYADRGRVERRFAVGDEVLLSTKNLKLTNDEGTVALAKLLRKYIGPYTIIGTACGVQAKIS